MRILMNHQARSCKYKRIIEAKRGRKMKKRINVPYEVKKEVASFLVDNPDATGRVLKREVEKSIRRKTGRRYAFCVRTYQNLKIYDLEDILLVEKPAPRQHIFTERTYQKLKKQMDLTPSDLDFPWHIGACLKYQIPSDVVPILIEEQRNFLVKSGSSVTTQTKPMTIRQARWFALLHPLISKMAKEQYPDDPLKQHACLAIYARWYAFTERISELIKTPYPHTYHIDALLINGDLSEEALSDGIMEYCGLNEYRERHAREMSAWQGYTREQYEKVLGNLNNAQVSVLNEWIRVVGSESAISRRKWEKEHKEIIGLVKSKKLEMASLVMKIEDSTVQQALDQRYDKLTAEEKDMFYELMYSEDRDEWLQDHPEFVTEMKKKERKNERLNSQAK